MAKEIIMPTLGLTMTEGTVTAWHKKVGDIVSEGEALFDVETDKLTNTIQSTAAGILLKIVAAEGDSVQCNGIVAYVGEAGEAVADTAKKEPAADTKAADGTIIVIGGGPGGYVAAIRAAQLGAKVILVEKADVGGTCLNRGCMPTKALLHSSEVFEAATHSAELGVIANNVSLDWEKVQSNRASVVNKLTSGVRALIKANKIELILGEAVFCGEKKLRVGSELLSADKIIIASGGYPTIPPIKGIDSKACIDSTKCLALDRVPESMVVIGGGVIGLELGSAYARFGTKVTVLEMASKLLPLMDGELTAILQKKLQSSGMDIYTDSKVVSIEDSAAGASVKAVCPDGEKLFSAEKVLLCIGRTPDVSALKLDKAGIKTENGFISVNEHMETNMPGVYAVGDCTGKLMLAHAAMAMGEIAAENAMGDAKSFKPQSCPSCAYVGPEFAGVGYTEEKVKALGIEYKVGKFPTSGNGKSLVLGHTDGMVKIIAGKEYGEILGVHILAANATELIEQAALAIRLEATLDELNDTVYSHPTVSESIHEAALAAENRAIHIPNKK